MAALLNLWVFTFGFGMLFASSSYPSQVAIASRSFTIDYNGNRFLKDGEPFRYISGSIHYSRIPQYYWKDRLQKMHAGGLNAIQVYIPWNIHHTDVDKFDFAGQQDLQQFMRLAQDIGLLVILRPGPYICGEWDFGGIPAWILKYKPDVVLRTMDPTYIKYVDIWFNRLLPLLKPLLYVNGGPIIMVQVENEYGSYFAHDLKYTEYIRDKLVSYLGKDIVLFTTDGDGDGYLKNGKIPNVYATVDFGTTLFPEHAFKPQRDFEPKGPLVNSEFYTGWLDHWGQKHSVVNAQKVSLSLELLLKYKANINMYMYEGGTNFGYWNGANYPKFQPVPTSYDYDAPLTEAGDITEKYLLIRNVISKFRPVTNQSIPSNTPKAKYGKVQMNFVGTIQDLEKKLSPSGFIANKYPLTMEAIGQNQGFVMYRTTIKKAVSQQILNVPGIRDRGYVMLDQVPVGMIDRTAATSLNVTAKQSQQLDILIENQGHINYGSGINNNSKGLIQNVTLGGEILEDWMMIPISLDKLVPSSNISYSPPPRPVNGLMTPSIYIGKFTVKNSADTFLDMKGWTKGQALLYGQQNLGRYWPAVGPQLRLFVPKPYIQESPAENYLIMLELENSPCQGGADSCFISFEDTPIINGTTRGMREGFEINDVRGEFDWHKFH